VRYTIAAAGRAGSRVLRIATIFPITFCLFMTGCGEDTAAPSPGSPGSAPPPDESGPEVTTRYGAVKGLTEGGLAVFRAIPYAKAPIGELRLASPQPPEPWAGTREAFRYSPRCPQDSVATLGSGAGEDSEDCLFLNVWTPATDGRARPVMVWIHGGGNAIGSASDPMYDGAALAQHDVVVVTINYRLGVLGFLTHGALWDASTGAIGNWGVQDQIAALRWVHDNIEEFGGDADNVTVFGESAGAWDASTLITSPLSAGLVRRAIIQSGPPVMRSLDQAQRDAQDYFARAGCQRDDALACLRALPLAAIQSASKSILDETFANFPLPPTSGAVPGSTFTTLPAQDNLVFPQTVSEAIAAGATREIDLLIGTNADEINAFGANAIALDQTAIQDLLETWLIPGFQPDGRSKAQVVLETYIDALTVGDVAPSLAMVYGEILTDHTFRYFSVRFAELHAAAGGRARMYLFDFPVTLAGEAPHASELPFVFGHLELSENFALASNPDAVSLSRAMMTAWVEFARTGAPTIAGTPWPQYELTRRDTAAWGIASKIEPDPRRTQRQVWQDVDAHIFGL
jgi:para-nitrobenzyl esterase